MKQKISFDCIMYIVFGIYISATLIINTSIYASYGAIESIIKVIRYICYGIFAIRIIWDWKNGAHVTMVMLSSFAISLGVFYFSKNIELITLLLVLFALRRLNIEKILKITCVSYSIIFFTVVFGSILKIFPNWIYYREGEMVRHSLGFFYPTITIGIYFTILLIYVYLRKEKIKWLEIAIFEVINICVFLFTDGRLGFILINLLLIIFSLIKFKVIKNIFNNINVKKILCKILPCIPIVVCIMILLLIYIYQSGDFTFTKWINHIFSNRLGYAGSAFKQYGITLLGQEIQWKRLGGLWL